MMLMNTYVVNLLGRAEVAADIEGTVGTVDEAEDGPKMKTCPLSYDYILVDLNEIIWLEIIYMVTVFPSPDSVALAEPDEVDWVSASSKIL